MPTGKTMKYLFEGEEEGACQPSGESGEKATETVARTR